MLERDPAAFAVLEDSDGVASLLNEFRKVGQLGR